MSAEAVKIGAVAVAAAAPGAVAMSSEAMEAVEAAEAVDAEQAFGRLERLYAQLPAMEEKGVALARARSAAEVDGLAKAAAYRAAELVRAETLVAEAEAFVREAEAALARSEAAGGDAAEKAAHLGDLRLALMAAGTQRGLKVGPARMPSMPWPKRWKRVPSTQWKRPVRPCCRRTRSPLCLPRCRPTRPTTPKRWRYASSWKTAKRRRVFRNRPPPSR